MPNNLPSVLYKYRAFDKRSKSMLKKNQLFFSNPLKFNDPFDSLARQGVFNSFSVNNITTANGNSAINPASKWNMPLILDVFKTDDFKAQRDQIDNLLNEITSLISILCLSSCRDSILMWSHYSDYHKGFCIGFNENIGFKKHIATEVNYVEQRNNDTNYQYTSLFEAQPAERTSKLIMEHLLTKFIDWKYENEWRLFHNKHELVFYPSGSIEEIIFGLHMPIEQRNIIRKILKDQQVKYFEAIKSTISFKLDIIPCH